MQWSDSHMIFRAIEEENITELQKILCLNYGGNENGKENENSKSQENLLSPRTHEERENVLHRLCLIDSNGLTPLLFATDRGLYQVSEVYLIYKFYQSCFFFVFFFLVWSYIVKSELKKAKTCSFDS